MLVYIYTAYYCDGGPSTPAEMEATAEVEEEEEEEEEEV